MTNASLALLSINNYSVTVLSRITSLEIEGDTDTRGPLETRELRSRVFLFRFQLRLR